MRWNSPHSHRGLAERGAIGGIDYFAGLLHFFVADFELLGARDLRLIVLLHQGEQLVVTAFSNPIDDLADHLFDIVDNRCGGDRPDARKPFQNPGYRYAEPERFPWLWYGWPYSILPLDFGSESAEFRFDALVTSVNVIDAINHRVTLCCERSDN